MMPAHLRQPRFLLLFLLLPFFMSWGLARAQGSPAVMRGEALSMTPGEIVEVPILLENAFEVYAIDVQMRFDPALIEVVDAETNKEGVQVLAGSFPRPEFEAQNVVDNAAGTIRYVATQLNPTPPASGSGTVFSVRLRAKANGDSLLQFELVELASRDGLLRAVTTQDIAISAAGGAAGVTPGAGVVVPTTSAAGAGNNTGAATASTVPPTATPGNNSAAPTSAPAAGSTAAVGPSPLPSPTSAPDATIAPTTSGGDAQVPAAQEQDSAGEAAPAATGAAAEGESIPTTAVLGSAEDMAPTAVGDAPLSGDEQAAAPVVIGSGESVSPADSTEGAANPAVTDDAPAGNGRIALYFMVALLVLAAVAVGMIVLLIRSRTPSP